MMKINNRSKLPRLLQCASLVLAALFSSSTLQGEDALEGVKHPVKPFLWKVEGKDLKKASYLFGTIHIGDPRVTTLHPAAEAAFEQAEYFYAEMDLSPENQLKAAPLMMRKDGKTLSESIGPELTAQLDAELKRINPALGSAPFEPMKTWLVATLPAMLPEQLSGRKALDVQLWERATAGKKKTAGLETAERQMGAFDILTEPEQVTFLKESLRILAEDRAEKTNGVKRLVDAYIVGEMALMREEINDALLKMLEGEHQELGQKIWESILVSRDKTMSEGIVKALTAAPESSHFVGVGTAHYCTEKSILFHLKEAGYTVTRIEE